MKKILIIDDERDFIDLVSRRLKKNNFDVVQALDGEEGWQKAQVEKPDLIILDIMMPKLDGREVVGRLNADAALKNIPVIILTASVAPKTIKGILALGIKYYLIKPFDPKELIKKINTILGIAE